jgi:molecular chaperone GrpE
MPDRPDNQNDRSSAADDTDQGAQPKPEILSGETFGPDADLAAEAQGAAEPRGAEIEQLRRERDENHDRLLRKTAEFENYRKRTDKERRELAQYAAGDLLEALLPIIDDFERALQADAGADPEAYRKGVELIYKQLQALLARRGVTLIEAVGKDFDPRFHQAITHEESPGHRDGEVIEEVQRGYMHGERLLRPAMVKVAKA